MSARYRKDLNMPDFTISFTPVRIYLVITGIIFSLKAPAAQNQKLQ